MKIYVLLAYDAKQIGLDRARHHICIFHSFRQLRNDLRINRWSATPDHVAVTFPPGQVHIAEEHVKRLALLDARDKIEQSLVVPLDGP